MKQPILGGVSVPLVLGGIVLGGAGLLSLLAWVAERAPWVPPLMLAAGALMTWAGVKNDRMT